MAMGTSNSLVFLPQAQVELTTAGLRAAYGPTLTGLLVTLENEKKAGLYSHWNLDIVFEVDASGVASDDFVSTRLLHLFGKIYDLIGRLCAERAVDLHSSSSIDLQVLATYADDGEAQTEAPKASMLAEHQTSPCGPIIPMSHLATRSRLWDVVFIPDSDSGQGLLDYFTRKRGSSVHQEWGINRLPAGNDVNAEIGERSQSQEICVSKQHLVIAMGGTFDHLHLGHRSLLTAMALLGASRKEQPDEPRRLIVGITGDEMLKKKKFHELLEPWDERQDAVARFLNAILNFNQPFQDVQPRHISEPGSNGHAVHYQLQEANVIIECVEISDAFGPTITDESVSALVISGETRSGGKAVNDKREGMGWAPLEIIEVDVLDARSGEKSDADTDYQNKISSTAIRQQLAEQAQRSAG